MGFGVEMPTKEVIVPADQPEAWVTSVTKNVKPEDRLQLLVFVLPTNAENRYQAIKQVCTRDCPVSSQCVGRRFEREMISFFFPPLFLF